MLVTLGGKYGRAFGVAILVTASVLSLAGCSNSAGRADASGESASDANSSSSDLKGFAQWVMPLDEFRVYPMQLDNYAEQLQLKNCLEPAGYQWPVPWQDTNFPQPEDFNRTGYRLFNKDIAAKHGYHLAPPQNEKEAAAWVQFDQFSQSYGDDAAFHAKFSSCLDGIRSKDGLKYMNDANYISELGSQATSVAKQEKAVQSAVERWRSCLTPKVSFAVPADPWAEMPPISVGEQFGIIGQNRTATPTSDEIAAAVADADCRDSSKVSETLYLAIQAQQKKLVDKNRDKLDRIRADATQHQKDLLRIVAENAPAAP